MHMSLILLTLCLRKPDGTSHLFSIAYAFAGNGCILYETLVHLELMPYRELATPEELKAALLGGDRLIIDATERAYHRSQDDAKQREHDRGKKNGIR
jgi:hypothetical protein